MARRFVMLAAASLLVLTLAGCIGSDEVAPESDGIPEEAEEAVVTEQTGSVKGQVITVDLEWLVGIEVGLMNRTGGLELTVTDKQGRFTFNDVTPGPYRVQVNEACCKVTSQEIVVNATEVTEVNMQVERLTAADLAEPFVVELVWEGFVSCDVSAFSAGLDLCGTTAVDPNHDRLYEFEIEKGIQDLVFAMVWDENTAAEDVYGNALGLHVHNFGCDTCGHRYVRADESSPIVRFLNDDTITPDEQDLSRISDKWGIRYSVFSGGTNVVYQQAFTMYTYLFYHQMAPAEFDPVPAN